MIENKEKEYEFFRNIPLKKYWNRKWHFGVVLHMENPHKLLRCNWGRAEIRDAMRDQVGRFFIGKARGERGYIGGGSVNNLRSYVLAWKSWIENWPFSRNEHRQEFHSTLDELCIYFDVIEN